MVLGDDAVSALYKYIVENIDKIGIQKVRVFKYEIPEKLTAGDYIAINHLPFVYNGEINEGVVNLNIHCPKTAQNLPDSKKLQTIAKNVICLFGDDIYLNGCYFEFYSISRPTKDNDDTYYVNIKFNVTYNNLK